ncbi:hypothetical protein [Streptomyces sp. NBC_00847]|uniref:hypothetical protein n=1 Tax=Streptomyces sp. NBC_00847 TaxID=2975850 RepID=UPI00224F9C28|nr:hypothetical protein [Streptomyces sp. NBC_00847]MCX4878103.1 hypothetical protein [Streptomyces sp. NBC_00847]
MPDLYDLFAARKPEVTGSPSSTPPPTPGTIHTASIETIDNDRAGMLLGALNL